MAGNPDKFYHILCHGQTFTPPQNMHKIFSVNKTGDFIGPRNQSAMETLPPSITENFEMFINWLLDSVCLGKPKNIASLLQKSGVTPFQGSSLHYRLNEQQLIQLYKAWQQQKMGFESMKKSSTTTNGAKWKQPEIQKANGSSETTYFETLDESLRSNLLDFTQTNPEAVKKLCQVNENWAQFCQEYTFIVADSTGQPKKIKSLDAYLEYMQYPTLEEIAETLKGQTASAEEIIEYFSEPNADINHKFQGRTLLDMAVEKPANEIIEKLIIDGGDVNIPDASGKSLLFKTIQAGEENIAQTLIDAGADVHKKSPPFNISPLVFAITRDKKDIAKALIQAGADVNERTPGDTSILMLVAQQGHEDIVDALITAGADVNLKNLKGETALLLAQENGFDSIAQNLINAGAT